MSICDYVNDNNLKNPMYKFHYIMYEENGNLSKEQFMQKIMNDNTDSIETEWLVKNIEAHFYKLVNAILNLLEFQNIKQEQDIKLNIDMEMTIVNLVEYFYIKQSTILDLLDVFYKLFFNSNKPKKQLEETIRQEMEEYFGFEADDFSILRNLYKDEILNIRNRIIHNKGYSIKAYILENEFLFQVYDSNKDELINPYPIYSHYSQDELSHRAPLIKVNDYVTYHLCLLYKYIDIYLEFLLAKKGFDKNTIHRFYKTIIDSSKYIVYMQSDLSSLQKILQELESKIKKFETDK